MPSRELNKPGFVAWLQGLKSSPEPRYNTRELPSAYHASSRGLKAGEDPTGRVFGVKLEQSLKYASVAISMVGDDGEAHVFGYVPIIVAKAGMFLKHNAVEVEGIFRVSGATRRINELQAIFDLPPRYGKDLDWRESGYTVHDAASILRRFLNAMPEPVIPENLYRDFTAVLQSSHSLAYSISAYRTLIALLPPTSRYLLLYLLDFLSVFARSADKNLMTSSNLAVVFQPGLVSTREASSTGALLGFPGFEGSTNGATSASKSVSTAAGLKGSAGEHGRAKEVLEFLIEQQAHFVLEQPLPRDRDPYSGGVDGEGEAPLARKSSTKSVDQVEAPLERRGSRRLRKSHDGHNGKVKRTRTHPGKVESSTPLQVPLPPLSADRANITRPSTAPPTATPDELAIPPSTREQKRSSALSVPAEDNSLLTASPKSREDKWWRPRRSSERER